MYEKFFKRMLDMILSMVALVVLSPILILLITVGAIAMKGNPFFVQPRPGKMSKDGKETIFKLVKFRTMSNAKDERGNLLPDDVRLNRYGKFLRSTSLDELPELVNILLGQLSIVGPRPQLVADMVFMTARQRKRHSVRQGLTGLAQCNGRNSLTWERKIEYDLEYIENITFLGDVKIILKTVVNVIKREGISEEGLETAQNLGDYLLSKGEVSEDEYMEKLNEARMLVQL